jgi:hypothetical protein
VNTNITPHSSRVLLIMGFAVLSAVLLMLG